MRTPSKGTSFGSVGLEPVATCMDEGGLPFVTAFWFYIGILHINENWGGRMTEGPRLSHEDVGRADGDGRRPAGARRLGFGRIVALAKMHRICSRIWYEVD